MSYNNGTIKNDFYDNNLEDKINVAKDFAEGNSILEQALLVMWENGIKTFGCCNGHQDRDIEPFISFEVNDNSMLLIDQILNLVLENSIDVNINFYHRIIGSLDTCEIKELVMSIYMTEKNKNFIFQSIQKYSKKIIILI